MFDPDLTLTELWGKVLGSRNFLDIDRRSGTIAHSVRVDSNF